MYKERKESDYSSDLELSFEELIEHVGLVELQLIMSSFHLDPEPTLNVKYKLEDLWLEREEKNNYQNILNKYESYMYLYKSLKSKEPFISVNFLKSVVDYAVAENKFKVETYGEDPKESLRLKTFNSASFKNDSKYSELFSYHITYYIRSKNDIFGRNLFIQNIESEEEYLNFKTFTFKKEEYKPTREVADMNFVEEVKNQLKMRASTFSKEDFCEEHKSLFCEKCFYKKYRILGFQEEYLKKNGSNNEILNYKIIKQVRKHATPEDLEEITKHIYEKVFFRN